MFKKHKYGVRFPKTGITGGCKLPDWVWEPKLGPLQDQQYFNDWTTSLAPLNVIQIRGVWDIYTEVDSRNVPILL